MFCVAEQKVGHCTWLSALSMASLPSPTSPSMLPIDMPPSAFSSSAWSCERVADSSLRRASHWHVAGRGGAGSFSLFGKPMPCLCSVDIRLRSFLSTLFQSPLGGVLIGNPFAPCGFGEIDDLEPVARGTRLFIFFVRATAA